MLSFADAVSLGGDFPLSGNFRDEYNPTQGQISYFTAIPRSLCHLWNSPGEPAPGFGAAYNVFSSAKELHLGALCKETSVEYPVGNGDQFQYIYKLGYFWTGSWQPFPYNCQVRTPDGNWCVGNATYTQQNLTSTQPPKKYSYLAYVCNWTDSGWKCGCRDETCEPNYSYWNLQQFMK